MFDWCGAKTIDTIERQIIGRLWIARLINYINHYSH